MAIDTVAHEESKSQQQQIYTSATIAAVDADRENEPLSPSQLNHSQRNLPADKVCISEKQVVLKFRNYLPQDESLRAYCLPRPSVEELEKQILKEQKEGFQAALNEDILTQIAPKKENWDLKRDLKKKLAILNNRTDRSIVKLIKMKIEAGKNTINSVSESGSNRENDHTPTNISQDTFIEEQNATNNTKEPVIAMLNVIESLEAMDDADDMDEDLE